MASSDRTLPATLGARILRGALLAFPPMFRERYAGEMMETLVDMIQDARQRQGRRAALALLFTTVADVVRTGITERVAVSRRARATRLTHSHFAQGDRRLMSALMTDVRFAFRSLWRRPAFSLVAISTLAVGIGASTAMFALASNVLYRPLPYPESERLVRFWDTFAPGDVRSGSSSPANFYDWRAQQTAFAGMFAYNNTELAFTGIQPAESFVSAEVSAGFTETMGVRPLLGRGFSAGDEVFGSHRSVLVGHGFWRRFLSGDSAVVGRPVSINGVSYVIAGVMPQGFAYPTAETQLWVPMAFDYDVATSRGVHYITVVGRLKPDVTLDAASTEMSTIMSRLVTQFPERLEGYGVRLESLRESIIGNVRGKFMVFLGAVGLLLVVAVVNVANLMLAQALTRFRELAVRAALGAGSWRLTRQLVAEGMTVAIIAGALSVAVSAAIIRGVVLFAPSRAIPRAGDVHFDPWALGFAALVSLVIGGAVSAWPVLRIARRDLIGTLKQATRGATGGAATRRLRHAFLVAQLSLAVVLAVGAALLVRSFGQLAAVSPGYDASNALVATINTPSSRYPEPANRARFFLELTDRLREMPGVSAAAATTQLPLDGYSISFSYWLAGSVDPEKDRPGGDFRAVTPGYFEAMGIPVRSGRTFTRDDAATAPAVIVIEESLARQHFGNRNPVGERLHLGYGPGHVAREIIGVVGDVRQRALDVAAQPGYYVPVAQIPWSTMRLVVRTELDPMSLSDVVRREAAAIDPLIAVRNITTLGERFDVSVGSQRFSMLLLGAFALLAVLLATAGVYSVMSHLVAQLTRDIGVQMALGAKASAVRRQVSLRALRVAAAGTALGLIVAAVLAPRISQLLFQVSARDPAAFAAAPVVFLGVALLGSYLPARRASNVDPVIALRAD